MGSKSTHITTVVRLKNKGIKNLEEVPNLQLLPLFTRLQTILLQHNKISTIPDSVCSLLSKSPRVIEYLQELNLSHNRLTDLPNEFFLLINLRRLYLDYNELTLFFPQLLSFYKLEELSVRHNNIKHLPWGLNRMKRLKILHLENNLIDYVPNTLGKLANLIDFGLLPNPLSSIDDEDFLIACHSGDVNYVLEFILTQNVPSSYPFIDDMRQAYKRKLEKHSQLSEDQHLLTQLLKNKEGYASVLDFMTKEHSTENILFWKALSTFSNNFSSDQPITTEELIQEAKKIFDEFIHTDSKYTLNLPAQVTNVLVKIFTDKFVYPQGINQFVFKDACKAALDLMTRDTFRRYKNSPDGAKMVALVAEKEKRAVSCLAEK